MYTFYVYSKAGINEVFEAHQGPVTGIDCHHVQGQLDFSHLFLTSSFDWTVKLWSSKTHTPLHRLIFKFFIIILKLILIKIALTILELMFWMLDGHQFTLDYSQQLI